MKKPALTKECLICKIIFFKKINCSKKEWKHRKYCSHQCQYEGQKVKWQKNKKLHPHWKGGQIKKKCLGCKKEFFRDPCQIDKAKYCSRKCSFKGRTGITFECLKLRKSLIMPRQMLKDLIRNKIIYKLWRTAIFERDKYTCKNCGIIGGKLHADHIKQFSVILDENKIETVKQAMECAELWDINNGRTLCVPCHRKTDTWGKKYFFVNAGISSSLITN